MLSSNKYISYKRCKREGLRFGLVYIYSPSIADTVYALYDWGDKFTTSISGTFFELDLALDVCSWLNWRDRNDRIEEEMQ